jgi:transposase
MTMLAEVVDAVVGGDTHRDTHTLEIATAVGAPLATLTVSNDEAGYAAAADWIARCAPGQHVVVGLEGTRAYGVGLARALTAAGWPVLEVERPRRADRRRGKSDPIDAHLAVLALLRTPLDKLAQPRADGDREALRILLAARRDLVFERTGKINRLRALLRGGDSDIERDLARARLTDDRLAAIARRRGHRDETLEQATRRIEARRLAIAIRSLATDLSENKSQLVAIVEKTAPRLLHRVGIGPVSAAQAIVSWSHPGRCRNEAAYASLAGASPLPASSGKTVRHRLNRGGDRALNRALHDIMINRWRVDERTHTYITRRRAEGKTDPEIRRCLKRYIARELFNQLERTS